MNLSDPDSKVCKKRCASCQCCNFRCTDFTPISYHCNLLDKATFVCNGCKKKCAFRLDKMYYRASTAQRQYKTILVESGTGINISENDLATLDNIVSPLIFQGQSPYMILQHHPEMALSEKTIYNYIKCGALTAKNIDLPKKVVYKVRNVHKSEICDASIFGGRTYKEYCNFMSEYPETKVVEMDTVVGCEGDRKVLLTLHFCTCHFMVEYLLNSKEPKHVTAVFDGIIKIKCMGM